MLGESHISRLFAAISTVAFALFFVASPADADCVTTISYPAQDQVVKGEVPVMISIGSTGQDLSVKSVDLADIEVEYMSDGSWVLQDDLSAQSMLEPIEGSSRKAVIYSIANNVFKGRYGHWRMRARCANGDNSPWSSWRQFQVNESTARKHK